MTPRQTTSSTIRTAQKPSGMPFKRYVPFLDTNPISLPDRTWPDKRITHAPRWLTTDLRDGNQALIEPMDPARKRELFDLLVQMGYKEIEIGFPSASQTDFDFVRSLIEDPAAIPEDVTVSVLTQARRDLIDRTLQSVIGAHHVNVHLYNAASPMFRDIVFRKDKKQTIELAVDGTRDVMEFADKHLTDETVFGYEYSPEIFMDTELDFALEISEAVMDVWQPEPGREIIINLPATVERATPNIYADQIEWMSRNLSHRDEVCLSVHTHNDRGCAVAAIELALLAGADRVEGCLFGQGERTGNVDLVTLGLNLFTQGVDPMIDFSDIDRIRRVWEHCNRMEVPVRAPYGGDLVYTSFSGSHQDAIKKGFEARAAQAKAAGVDEREYTWTMPYLPLDPRDVGRTYEAVIRVNSQSGKGGIAYLLKSERHLDLPRRLQVEFSKVVQHQTDAKGGEMTADDLWAAFADEYLPAPEDLGLEHWGRLQLRGTHSSQAQESGQETLYVDLVDGGNPVTVAGKGNGPINSFLDAIASLGINAKVLDYAEHALSEGSDATAVAYTECEIDGQTLWGVGIDPSITTASLKAILSAINRAQR
ncbi:MAG: 2-isopropylmalate synthase [Bifidobacteriaceae bacterium]|jgi:2-isopropylmalate synthase|nr:2-isopropylmalate synthase [Bifidobacteriaceae bacterium]